MRRRWKFGISRWRIFLWRSIVFEQLAVVLKSYNRWSVRTLVVLGMLWLAFVYWYVQGEYLDPLGYINLFGPMLLVFFGALGSKAKSEFVPFRSRLIPH